MTIGHVNKALLTRPLMARGCELCFAGSKSVIFITGLCDDGCYYCPVSKDRLGKDVIYVNETPVSTIDELINEVERTGSRGASITGGDPLIRPDRVLKVIRSLKDHFGFGFHIHLYTSGRYAHASLFKVLERVGLDEIRFHPTIPTLIERARIAKTYTNMSVGIEIPIAPHLVNWAKNIIMKADKIGLDFVNINEMEFVEPNAKALLARGLRESRSRPFTVEGALEAAIEVLEWAKERVSIPVHFCPASFKDKIQTRNRLLSTARRDLKWDEIIDSSGTVTGIIPGKDCEVIFEKRYPTLNRELKISLELTHIECQDGEANI